MISIRRLALVAVLAALLCACAAPASRAGGAAGPARASVIGGGPVAIGAYPWLAFVTARESGRTYSCTGTVVAPRLILTAGHCAMNLETGALTAASDFSVVTGSGNLSAVPPANLFSVSRTVLYPGFSLASLRGDAALLILSEPSSAPAISLASAADAGLLQARTPVVVAGWGLTDPRAGEIPAQLQAGSTVVQGPGYCRQGVGRYYPFFSPEVQLCAIDPPSFSVATCHGDSGGPAIAVSRGSAVEVGITSLGVPECSPDYPDVFTRVDRVSPWVESWIAATEGSAPTPAVSVPEFSRPRLTIRAAKRYVARGLREDFRHRYRWGWSKRARCWRIDYEKVKCWVSWSQGPNDYFGTITIYYVLSRESLFWNDRYRIRWVNRYCRWPGAQARSCPTRTRVR
jgi:secreted trypsin-like serine protease